VELRGVLAEAEGRVRALAASLEETRVVGKKLLPTTVAGLLIHRGRPLRSRHVAGRRITTAKVIAGNLERDTVTSCLCG